MLINIIKSEISQSNGWHGHSGSQKKILILGFISILIFHRYATELDCRVRNDQLTEENNNIYNLKTCSEMRVIRVKS